MPGILKNRQSSLGKRKRSSNGTAIRNNQRSEQTKTLTKAYDEDGEEYPSGIESKDPDSSSESEGQDDEQARDIFRRAFEKRFAPLHGDVRSSQNGGHLQISLSSPSADPRASNVGTVDTDGWEGFDSDVDSTLSIDAGHYQAIAPVQIVNHATDAQDSDQDAFSQCEAKRAFMSARPPSSSTKTNQPSAGNGDGEDAQTAQEHLKNDLALSRLIQESKLLSKTPGATTEPVKQHIQGRLKTTESRLAALGAKESTLKQRNVPAAIRKGIKNKERGRDERRRRDAKENGVILEKAANFTSSEVNKKRQRSVGNPSVGKFKGGMLTLGKRDLERLTTPRMPIGRGGKMMKNKRR